MNFSRKKIILISAISIVILFSFCIMAFTDLKGLTRNQLKEDMQTRQLINQIGDARVRILYLASLAPSPHNTQPWKATILAKDTWIISTDTSRQMRATDPSGHRLMIAMGAFLENLSIAAASEGYDAKITIIADSFTSRDIAEVTLTESKARPYPITRITSRKTMKNGFLNKKISNEHLGKISEPLQGHFFFFPSGTWHSDCIRKGAVNSFQAWLDSDRAQEEHVAWLRMSNSLAEKKRDGLTTDGMEIKGVLGWFIRTFMSEQSWAGPFMKEESMKFTRKTSHEGAGYAIITGYGNDVTGMIETGRRFKRMALLARDYNIGIQPMTQILEMKSGNDLVASSHAKSISPQLVLRIGYVENYPQPVSLRRPVGWFTTVKNTK